MRNKALGASRTNGESSRRLIRAASEQAAAKMHAAEVPQQQVERRRRTAAELNLGQHLPHVYNLGPWWTSAEVALLGKLPDEEVAAKVGRTHNAVRIQAREAGHPQPMRPAPP